VLKDAVLMQPEIVMKKAFLEKFVEITTNTVYYFSIQCNTDTVIQVSTTTLPFTTLHFCSGVFSCSSHLYSDQDKSLNCQMKTSSVLGTDSLEHFRRLQSMH